MLAPHTILQDRYRIDALAGQGGMGAVYRATDLRLGHTVALKHRLASGDDLQAAFEHEARLLARLRHPVLPAVTDHFIEAGGQYLVMAFVPGDDLAAHLLRRKSPFPIDTVLAWADDLLDALTYLHTHDPPVLHRDIKPQNLKLSERGKVVLVDFGLAKDPAHTMASLAGYTLTYAPPEQIRGEGTTPQSDLFALAATLYDLLAGQAPRDALQRLTALGMGEPDPLRPLYEHNPDIPASVADVLVQALALHPDARPAGADTMRQMLRQAANAPDESVTVLAPAPAPPSQPAAAERVSPPPPAQPSRLTNLPVAPNPLLGRDADIAAAQALLTRPDVRLVTLTGTGGTGKTRLAMKVAHSLLADFPDGVWFVDLGPLTDPALVASAIAQAVDVRETVGRSVTHILVAHLQPQRTLLILDNVEHVIDAAQLVAELLTSCPDLHILATSREPLRLRAEHEFPVAPLPVPAPTDPEVEQNPAVALFVQRAQAVSPGFALTPANTRVIAEICARLDGLPLAIELAAARSKLLPPEALQSRLDQRLTLLTGGPRDLPKRQQTLRTAISWSYDLLSVEEQSVFRRLAVFAGSCALDAAEAVAGDGLGVQGEKQHTPPLPIADHPSPNVLDVVSSLLDKSLLRQGASHDLEPRLSMLETIREFGLEQLVASGEEETTRQAHAAYYLALAEQAEPLLRGPEQAAWLDRLETENANLRAALRWTEDRGTPEERLRLAAALWGFWRVRGYWREGRGWLERALAADGGAATLARARACLGAAVFARGFNDRRQAATRFEESLSLYRTLNDDSGVAKVLGHWGIMALNQGDYAQAKRIFEECLSIERKLGSTLGSAHALHYLGQIAHDQGDIEQATALYEQSLTLFRKIGQKDGTADALRGLGLVARDRGDHERAIALFEESLVLSRELGSKSDVSSALGNLALLVMTQGDTERAKVLCEECLEIEEANGDALGIAYSFLCLADAARLQDDLQRARSLYRDSLARFGEINHDEGRAFCLEGLAAVSAAQRRPNQAAQLYGAAQSLRATMGFSLPPADLATLERDIAGVRADMDADDFALAWEAGRTQPIAETIAATLEEASS